MHLCLGGLSALALLRTLRRQNGAPLDTTCGVPEPDPWPQKRWSPRLIPCLDLGRTEPPDAKIPVEVVMPRGARRPKASFLSVTVCEEGIPAGSFVRVKDEFTIPCPELLFLELASVMDRAALELVGYELCGTFARDPTMPRTGPVAHGVAPVTTVDNIAAYLGRCRGVRGLKAARRAIGQVRDNAWSAMEALMALVLVRDVVDYGFGLSGIRLNEREGHGQELAHRGVRSSRVPDISLEDLPVGFNYDGRGHLDLTKLKLDTDQPNLQGLRDALTEVRSKYVDDVRRNRELLARGRIVMPVVAEDLIEDGGFDTCVLEAVLAAERLVGTSGDIGARIRSCLTGDLAAGRQRLIWSLYPWNGGPSLDAY